MATDRDALLAELAEVGEMIRTTETALTGLYSRRLALFRVARRLDPPVTQRVLGDAAGITEVAVIAAIKKAERAEDARAGAG